MSQKPRMLILENQQYFLNSYETATETTIPESVCPVYINWHLYSSCGYIAYCKLTPIYLQGQKFAEALQPWTYNNTFYNTTQTYHVISQFFEHGFKRFGSVNASQKMMIIGDSYTEMKTVHNGEEWYAYLEDAYPDTEFFVFGAGGFGTYEEYLILERFYDLIKPDVVLLQFYSLDYIDNSYVCQSANYPFLNLGYSTFYENGKTVELLPLPLSEFRTHHRLADYALYFFDHIDLSISRLIDIKNRCYADDGLREEAYQKTKEIFKFLQSFSRDHDVDLYVFFAASYPLLDDRLCDELSLHCIQGVSDVLDAAEQNGYEISAINDRHWNLYGNKIVGEYLVDYFEAEGILS